MNLIKKTLASLRSPMTYLFYFFLVIIGLLLLFSTMSLIFDDTSNTALKELLDLDIERLFKVLPLILVSSLLVISLIALVYITICDKILKRNYEDKNLFNILKFIGLCFFLLGSLLVFNTTQFATLIGVISLSALVWPRIKE